MKKRNILFLLILPGMLMSCQAGPMGPQGEPGINGSNGTNGVDGKDGTNVLSGTGAPSQEIGKQGDIYVDVSTGDVYSRSSKFWIKTGNIKGNDGKDGKDGKDGISILGVSKTSSSGNVDTYTITYSDGSKSSFVVTNGKDGTKGAQGVKGEDGHTPLITIGSNGNWYVDGEDTGFSSKGDKGDKGEKGDKGDNGNDGVSIVSISLDRVDGKISYYTIHYSDGTESYFTTRDGEDGKTPDITIGDRGDWIIDGVDTGVKAKGDKGEDGVSITEVSLNNEKSDETKSVYTIHYSNGNTSEFVVTNGKDGLTPYIGSNGNWWVGDTDTGISAQGPKGDKGDKGDDGKDGVSVVSITKTSSDGNIDTYTIAYSDGSSSTFYVTNGINGIQGQPGKDGLTPVITIGSNGNWFVDGEDTGISARGEKGDKGDKGDTGKDGADGKDGVSVINSYIDENGDLICELSNGQKINAGHVKDVTKHIVTFHVDDEIVSTIQVEDGTKISRPSDETTVGYTIDSWHIIDANGQTFDWAFPIYKVEDDLDLYADYRGNKYLVSYVDNVYGKVMDTVTVTYDLEYALPKLTGVDGYTHVDWKTDGGVSYGFSGKWRTPSDVTLYAEWKNNEYTVTLNPAKGSVSESIISVTYDKPYSIPTPERDNYTFLGWYDEEEKFVSQNATWKRTKDETFTAKWTNVQNTYVFDPGDGTCEVSSMVIGWEDEYELPEAECFDGLLTHAFDGWYLGETKIPQKGTWTYSNAGGTLIAKYFKDATVKLGEYPQSRVTDTSTLSLLSAFEKVLPSSRNSGDWTSYEYYISGSNSTDFMWYKDVECGNNRYRGVYFTSYRPYYCSYSTSAKNSNQDDNGYQTGKVYWFGWEPIIWNVLSNDNEKYSLLSDHVLDGQQFYRQAAGNSKRERSPYDSNETASVYDNNYKYSDIRGWLNTVFYDSCFSEHQKTLIKTTSVDNSISSTGYSSNSYACEDTNDNVFLLSYKETTDSANGFTNDTSRSAYATDYAKCQGVYANSSKNTSPWWLRSPDDRDSNYAWSVNDAGGISGVDVNFLSVGVRPAIKINLD